MDYFIFDLDDTLYNLMEPFEKAHIEIFADRTDADCEDLFRMSRVYSDQAFYALDTGKITKDQEFDYRITRTYADVGITVTKEESKLFEQRYRYYQRHITLPEKIKEMLQFFKEEQIPIGVLTNGSVEYQSKKLEVLGISNWIPKERQFISRKIGYSKPDIRIFQKVAEALAIPTDHLWYIGDAFEMDIAGAANAGWHTVWFNHRHRLMPELGITPDATVTTLDEFITTMKELTLSNK